MAFTSKLAELFVQFSTRGTGEVSRALGDVKSQLNSVTGALNAAGIDVNGELTKVKTNMEFVAKGLEAAGGGAVKQFGELQKVLNKLDLKARPEVSLLGVDKAKAE